MATMLVYNTAADSLPVAMTNAIAQNRTNEIEKIIHGIITIAHENDYARGNLWQNFLTHFILSNENTFSLACERKRFEIGSLRKAVFHDFEIFMEIFKLRHPAMSMIENYESDNDSSPVVLISKFLAYADTAKEFYEQVTNFYECNGVGIFAFNKAFRLDNNVLTPIANADLSDVTLDDLTGYEIQKKELRRNTEAFVNDLPANNVLLYGDGGTGKSTSVKALLNEYYMDGLRVVELYKHQFKEIPSITRALRARNYKFIIFIDDLSFEEDESDFKYLKAVIEGGIATRPENILIYATSNRRHIIREVWSDRDDMEHNGDIHRSDTVEEKLSLASRFGIAINYSSPSRQHYHAIVKALAEKAGLLNKISDEELFYGADRWEIQHGGKTGRAARQYVDYLSGLRTEEE
ncbi:MAG: ATP-binding protein [Synergistaceae bacterium]|nr:ATP-binding protein [Synergistaceae bacterium]